jgi:hypothetical protein
MKQNRQFNRGFIAFVCGHGIQFRAIDVLIYPSCLAPPSLVKTIFFVVSEIYLLCEKPEILIKRSSSIKYIGIGV